MTYEYAGSMYNNRRDAITEAVWQYLQGDIESLYMLSPSEVEEEMRRVGWLLPCDADLDDIDLAMEFLREQDCE